MKLLLVNNDSDSWQQLHDACIAIGHDITPIHFSDLAGINFSLHDAAVLSGGYWYDDEVQLLNTYAQELLFIRTNPLPTLGICLGMQLMHVALEKAVPLLDQPQSGYHDIAVNERGKTLLRLPEQLRVFKNHTRAILEAAEEFEVLADSPSHVEIMMHRERPLLGVQFHPEIIEMIQGYRTLELLIEAVCASTTKPPVNIVAR